MVRCWSTKQGLPQNAVTALLQSRDGYLWVGTKAGLARFDGVRFQRFGAEDGLPTGEISSLMEARDGALWVGAPNSGVFRWQNGHSINLCAELSSKNVTALTETFDGAVWIGTATGLDCWKGGQVAHQGEREGLPTVFVHALYTDRAGTLWVACGGAGIFQLRGGNFVPEPAPFDNPLLKPGYCFFEDQKSALWLSIGNGNLLCKKDGVWQTYGRTNGVPFYYVNCLAQAVNGTLWAGSTGEGLVCLKGDRFVPLTTSNGLSDNFVLSALADREGNVWVGTAAGGLNRLTPKKLATLAAPQGLTREIIRSIVESADGMLWVVSRTGGLYRGNHDQFEPYQSPTRPEGVDPDYYYPGVYPNSECILAAQDGTLWLGGPQALFHLGKTASKIFKANPDTKWINREMRIAALAEDANHTIWVGTSDGKILASRNGEFFPVQGVTNNSWVVNIASATNGTIWAGTSGSGLLQLRTNALVATLTSQQGLGSDFITALKVGRDGTLWIGTDGGGLNRWKDGHCLHFTAKQGLPESSIVQILEDDTGDLWVGSARGICRVRHGDLESLAAGTIAKLQPLMIGEMEGMLAEECSFGSSPNCLKTRDGRLYFTTVKGMVVINPKDYNPINLPATARLEEVLFNGKIVHQYGGEKVLIPPGRGNLEIHYTGLGSEILESIQFRYKLTGADADWVEAGERRTANYSQLPPGKYRFDVFARSGQGPWPVSGASMELTLQPYFYETRWFFVSSLALAALALIQTVRVISHRKLQRRLHWIEMQNAVEKERSRIAKDIHDDLGASLTQMTMWSETGQAATSHPDDHGLTFAKIADKSRLAVQSLDEIVWAVNPKNDNLPRLVRYICRHADECFDSSNIRCWQKVPEDLPASHGITPPNFDTTCSSPPRKPSITRSNTPAPPSSG